MPFKFGMVPLISVASASRASLSTFSCCVSFKLRKIKGSTCVSLYRSVSELAQGTVAVPCLSFVNPLGIYALCKRPSNPELAHPGNHWLLVVLLLISPQFCWVHSWGYIITICIKENRHHHQASCVHCTKHLQQRMKEGEKKNFCVSTRFETYVRPTTTSESSPCGGIGTEK